MARYLKSKLCPVESLREFIDRTEQFTSTLSGSRLLIPLIKPHKPLLFVCFFMFLEKKRMFVLSYISVRVELVYALITENNSENCWIYRLEVQVWSLPHLYFIFCLWTPEIKYVYTLRVMRTFFLTKSRLLIVIVEGIPPGNQILSCTISS